MNFAIMDETIENSFASVLVFYDQFNRTKLLSADLAKIAKKYGSKSDQLIIDLEKKYGIPIPKICNVLNVVRICQLNDVPDSYRGQLPAQFLRINMVPYDPVFDIRSLSFDAEKVLTSRRIITPFPSTLVYDNMSKCKPLLACYDGKQFKFEKVTKVDDGPKVPKTGKSIPILERIILDSSAKIASVDDIGNESLLISPFALAYDFLKEKTRVRVIMRKRAG